MGSSDTLIEVVESLQVQLWSLDADALCDSRGPILERMAAHNLALGAVLDELPDECLALAFQKGFFAAEAFTVLMVDRYGPFMLRWLARWGTPRSLAPDLIQHIYVKFYERGLAAYRPEENFRAYLRRSVYYLWIEKVCRAKRLYSLDRAEESVSPQPDPAQALLDREAASRIDEALSQLLPREQSVLREAMDGKSADETARALGLSKVQVFMAMFRGRRRLERLLDLPRRNHPAKIAPPYSSNRDEEPIHV